MCVPVVTNSRHRLFSKKLLIELDSQRKEEDDGQKCEKKKRRERFCQVREQGEEGEKEEVKLTSEFKLNITTLLVLL